MQKFCSFKSFLERKSLYAAFLLAAMLLLFHMIYSLIYKDSLYEAVAARPEGAALPIIMYHGISEDTNMVNDYVVTPESLEKDFLYLKENGYTPVFLSQAIDFVHCGGELPKKPVVITFDDGFGNLTEYLLPLLEKYKFKATVSVVGSYSEKADKEGLNISDFSYLTSQKINILFESSLVEFANHTYDMHNLNGERRGCLINDGESYEEYRSALLGDIKLCQDYLSQNCSIVPKVFTYPYGFYCEASQRIIKSAGFLSSLTCEERVNYLTPDPECLYNMGRFNRPGNISTEEFMSRISGDKA